MDGGEGKESLLFTGVTRTGHSVSRLNGVVAIMARDNEQSRFPVKLTRDLIQSTRNRTAGARIQQNHRTSSSTPQHAT